jgi:Flp pilus assembly protein TadD
MWVPLLLAAVTFLVYLPSLRSGFVYDARWEMDEEGFLTSISNLPAVLSLKVLGMDLMLAGRPGLLLFMMLIAAVCGKHPLGYHLCSNLLHAANVALLFILLRRLIAKEATGLAKSVVLKAQLAAIAVTLIFALHPIAVEPVAAVSYASDLLVAFFLLVALAAATGFRPKNFRVAMITGCIGTLCCFAATTCKESGIAAPLLLIVYWLLFRYREAKAQWLLFLGAAITVATSFLMAAFHLAVPRPSPVPYLGGSFSQVFLIQPRLWVFMMGKLLWPTHLSADYTLQNFSGLSIPASLLILAVVISLQVWLISKSRLGALGAAIYWLGLATVSNFVPLNRILADRFYYVPLAGVAMQMLAVLLMALRTAWVFRAAVVCLIGALLPLTLLTLTREAVFANDFSLWSDTLQVSPFSSTAHTYFGWENAKTGHVYEGIAEFKKALEINPNDFLAHDNLGFALFQTGHVDEAITHYRKALETFPGFINVHANLGAALMQKGQLDEAMAQFQKILEIRPDNSDAYTGLGNVLLQKGKVEEAVAHYHKALEINPNNADARNDLGVAFFKKGQPDEAVAQFQEALRLKPDSTDARNNLASVQAMARQRAGQK